MFMPHTHPQWLLFLLENYREHFEFGFSSDQKKTYEKCYEK